jgi:type III pantothenate kinase
LISSVTKEHVLLTEILKSKSKFSLFDLYTPTPLKNAYKTPETLGSDRILSAIGSFTLFPNQNVLTIDAGTCIKYNFVNNKNVFLGGAISPGIPMRLKAMHNFTSALPLIEPEERFEQWLGNDTRTSMLSGAQIGAVCEVDEVINRYKISYPDLKVVLTGGDSHYLSGQLKNPFFANQNNLLLGLNTVLLYNLED